jgi:manganese/iron transport system permease protein
MMGLAAGLASVSGVVGLYVSYYWGVPSGAAIVLASTLIFLVTWYVRGREWVLGLSLTGAEKP